MRTASPAIIATGVHEGTEQGEPKRNLSQLRLPESHGLPVPTSCLLLLPVTLRHVKVSLRGSLVSMLVS